MNWTLVVDPVPIVREPLGDPTISWNKIYIWRILFVSISVSGQVNGGSKTEKGVVSLDDWQWRIHVVTCVKDFTNPLPGFLWEEKHSLCIILQSFWHY